MGVGGESDDAQVLREQVHLSRGVVWRWVFVGAGFVCLGLGITGIILPLLPTTPFLLLAAACFARGSERFYMALLRNRYFGGFIRDWRESRGIPLRTKIWVIAILWIVLGATAIWAVPLWYVRLLLLSIGAGVSCFIGMQPTKPKESEECRERVS